MTRTPRKVPGIENRERRRRDGSTYWTFRIRWIDPATGERVGEEFDSQRDAVDFQAALRLARRSGSLSDLGAGRETLAEYAEDWWSAYATRNLSRNTLASYSRHWNLHALPRLGHLQLRALSPGVIARFRADLEQAGLGPHTVRKTMAVVQSMLRRAVEEDRIRSNPVAAVRKPRAPRQRAVQPLTPVQVEGLRAVLMAEDAALVSVLAYAGLRPEEALALEWRHVRRDTLLVEQKLVWGQIELGQKTSRPPRTVDLLAALRTDLAEHRLASGRPSDRALVFPTSAGDPWPDHRYRNWRRRTFRAAAHAAGLVATEPPWTKANPYDGPRPYDLRHSMASLLIHEGRLSVVEIAAQMGHSTQMLLGTYSHIFSELRGQAKVPADRQIAKARERRERRLG